MDTMSVSGAKFDLRTGFAVMALKVALKGRV